MQLILPDDALLVVLSKLQTADLCSAACVCRQWRCVCTSTKELWTQLMLHAAKSQITDSQVLALVARAQGGLRSLTFINKGVSLFRKAELAVLTANLSVSTSAELVRELATRRNAVEILNRVYQSPARAHARHYALKAKQGLYAKIRRHLVPSPMHYLIIGSDYCSGYAAGLMAELRANVPAHQLIMLGEFRTSQLDPNTHEVLFHPASAVKDKEGNLRVKRHWGFQQASSDVCQVRDGKGRLRPYTMLWHRDVASAVCMLELFFSLSVSHQLPRAFRRGTQKEQLVRPSVCDRKYKIDENGALRRRDIA
jgi:F-box-like